MPQINSLLSQSNLIFCGCNDGNVIFYDTKSKLNKIKLFNFDKSVTSLCLYTDLQIISANEDNVVLWDRRQPRTPVLIFRNVSNDEIGTMIKYDNTGLILLGDDDGKVMLCDIACGRNMEHFRNHDNIVTSVQYSKKQQKIYSTGLDCKIIKNNFGEVSDTDMFDMNSLIDDNEEEEVSVVSLSPPLINDMIIIDDMMCCAMENCSVEVFKFDDNFITYEDSLYGHNLGVSCLTLTQDFLVSTGNDAKLCFWQLHLDNQFEVSCSLYNNSKFNCLTSFDDGSICFSDVENEMKRVIISESGDFIINVFD